MDKEYKSKKKIIVIFTLFIALLLGVLVYAFVTKKIIFSNNEENKKKDEIKIKYTNVSSSANNSITSTGLTDVSEIVEEVMPSIVSITSKTLYNSGKYGPSFFGYNNYVEGAGSGVIIASDDSTIYILTNNHVVEDSTELTITFFDDTTADAKIKGISERKDVAVVYVDKNSIDKKTIDKIKIATIGSSSNLKVGNGVIAIGNALGYGQSVTTGVVSALNREVSTDQYVQDMIQIDAAINGGNSGGALLNSKGEVVGINTAKYSSNSQTYVEGMGFAIPISDVEKLIESLMKGENDDAGISFGVEGYMVKSDDEDIVGFYISNVIKGGNAEKAGLSSGDIIIKVDDASVSSLNYLRKVLNKKNKGEKLSMVIKHKKNGEYKEKNIDITLE